MSEVPATTSAPKPPAKITSMEQLERVLRAQVDLINLKKKFISFDYVPSSITRNPAAWGGQLEFHRSTKPIRFLCPGNGWGKALKSTEPVLVEKGWTPIGKLVVGDRVYGRDGKLHRVIGVHHQGKRPLYRVHFNDGTSVVCDLNHLWTVQTRNGRFRRPGFEDEHGQWQTMTLLEIIEKWGFEPKPVQRPVIPTCEPVQFPTKHVDIDPYVMGLLLGDGSFRGCAVSITTADPEIVEAVASKYPITKRYEQYGYTVKTARRKIRRMGMWQKYSHEKHVPHEYLFNDMETRLAVLQGLLDTDGNCEIHSSKVEFCTTSPQLAEDVCFLVRSLGGRATMHAKERPTCRHKGQVVVGLPAYRIYIRMDKYCPFRLSRKAQRWKPMQTEQNRIMVRFEQVETDDACCISVDAPDHLYITRDFIVTHNSVSMGHEWNAWATCSKRWQQTPERAVTGIWFCPGYAQWDKIRKEVLEPYCFDKLGWRYLKSEYSYVWPNGSVLQARSHEYDWTVEQGTNPDIVFFDELFPQDLWTEMQMRRRGKTKTRFCLAATQTQGMSWMYDALYAPWLEYHKAMGMGEEDATREQKHPDIFCWPLGGLRSNPVMTEEDFRWYEKAVVFSSEQEKKVRLSGGFGDWSGAAVFDIAAVRWMRERARQFKEVYSMSASIVPYSEAA